MDQKCDGDHCRRHQSGEVRLIPTGTYSNAILCRACFAHEIAFRRDRNLTLADESRFDLPTWDSLAVYSVYS